MCVAGVAAVQFRHLVQKKASVASSSRSTIHLHSTPFVNLFHVKIDAPQVQSGALSLSIYIYIRIYIYTYIYIDTHVVYISWDVYKYIVKLCHSFAIFT